MNSEDMAKLLADVKNQLDITWDDPATDRKCLELIASGMRYLNDTAGAQLGYLDPGSDGRTLLFEYVRYARDKALDVFENNYRSLILAMQSRRRALFYAEDAVSAGQ